MKLKLTKIFSETRICFFIISFFLFSIMTVTGQGSWLCRDILKCPCNTTIQWKEKWHIYPDGGGCPKYGDYELVFEDNFNGTSVDHSKWYEYFPWGTNNTILRGLVGNASPQYIKEGANNVQVSNGTLKLITEQVTPFLAKVDEGLPDNTNLGDGYPNKRSFNYTSGMIFSKQSFDFDAGKFEIRCKIPNIDGVWPAFWAFGGCGQEIDVFEFSNSDIYDASQLPAGIYFCTFSAIGEKGETFKEEKKLVKLK